MRVKTDAQTGKPRRGLIRRVLRFCVRTVLFLVAMAMTWVLAYRVVDPPGGIYMASESWRLGGIKREWRALDRISPHLVRAVIAAEDARFCDHSGFDFKAIRAALSANNGRRRFGASTITQQVAKNVFLWHGRTWLRKGLEAGFTVLIELFWPKQRIVEIYLNTSEFAEGVFGAEAAASHHFRRRASALTRGQAARLAAVLPNPKGRDPNAPGGRLSRRITAIAAGARTLAAGERADCALP